MKYRKKQFFSEGNKTCFPQQPTYIELQRENTAQSLQGLSKANGAKAKPGSRLAASAADGWTRSASTGPPAEGKFSIKMLPGGNTEPRSSWILTGDIIRL